MTAYHLLLLLCPLVLIGALARSRDVNLALLLLAAAVTIVFSGLRWNSDVDHPGYLMHFEEVPLLRDFSADSISDIYGEPGYLLLNSALRSAGLGFFFLTFLSALIAVASKAVVVHHFVRSAGVALVLYLCVHFITIELIQMRWAIASGLIALALLLQFQRRPWLAWATLIVAFYIHYFTIVFFLIALLMRIERESRLYGLLALLAALAAAVVSIGIELPAFSEVEAYILQRALRYIGDPSSTVGVMSYVKVLAYPVAYALLTLGRSDLRQDATTTFLRKLAFTCLAFALALAIVPVTHHRAVVLADLFSLMLLVRVIEARFAALERTLVLAVLAVPFCAWFMLDIAANFKADTLYEYDTWIPLLF